MSVVGGCQRQGSASRAPPCLPVDLAQRTTLAAQLQVYHGLVLESSSKRLRLVQACGAMPPCEVLPQAGCPAVSTTFRENAEAIAFYGGDVREASDLSSRLIVVLDVLLRRIAWLGGYELWLVVYRWAARLYMGQPATLNTWRCLGA